MTEALRYTEHLAEGLEELARLGYAHGDMHDRNVMREVIGENGQLPEVRYVVIDFSEAHPIADAQGGLQSDICGCVSVTISKAFADAIKRERRPYLATTRK